jgi:phosphatidylglycerol:prolipoprotein diacylglycerol transferase
VVIARLLGARLFHVLDHWLHEYASNLITVLYIWEGGLAIWGSVVGGLIALAFLAWRKRWRLPVSLDAAAPGLVLAQAILGKFQLKSKFAYAVTRRIALTPFHLTAYTLV